MRRTIELGAKYDMLTPIADLGMRESKRGSRHWYLCRCDCGNEIEVMGTDIGRDVKSCGCLRNRPLGVTGPKKPPQHKPKQKPERGIPPGTRFDRLEVIRKLDRSEYPPGVKDTSSRYLCKCDCGREVVVIGASLSAGLTKSCGCLLSESGKKSILNALKKFSAVRHEYYDDGTFIPSIKSKTVWKNNTSGVRGVYWDSALAKWVAFIYFKRIRYKLAVTASFTEAVAARKEAERRIYGEFLEWYYDQHPEKKPKE